MLSHVSEDHEKISQHLLGKGGEFSAYFKFYDDLFQRNNGLHLTLDASPALLPLTNECILRASQTVISGVTKSKADVEKSLEQELAASNHAKGQSNRAIGMAIQAMFMVDPAAKEWHSADFTLGCYRPSSWLPDESLVEFVERLFPVSLAGQQDAARVAVQHRALRARRLQKLLGARFRPTNNLAEHLLFDEQGNCLYLFHHVAFLKAHLSRYEGKPDPLSIGPGKSLHEGTLPPQLLAETLYSLQAVLFPSIDPVSARILDELIDKRQFDPESADYEGYVLFEDPPAGFSFVYWGERMAHLHTLTTRRPPRNKLERWFHSHSTEGNALLIALLALAISILVGVVSIGLNAVQIWITWMAWKHPVS